MQRSIKFQGVKIWNSISQTIQKLPKLAFHSIIRKINLQYSHI